MENFNPRSPCGERQLLSLFYKRDTGISIHAPRAGSDNSSAICDLNSTGFQSTLPVRGATGNAKYAGSDLDISIHAPRAGSDI